MPDMIPKPKILIMVRNLGIVWIFHELIICYSSWYIKYKNYFYGFMYMTSVGFDWLIFSKCYIVDQYDMKVNNSVRCDICVYYGCNNLFDLMRMLLFCLLEYITGYILCWFYWG